MSTRAAWLAWSLWAAAMTATALGLLLLALSLDVPVPGSFGFRGSSTILALAFSSVGALIALRHPANPIGWIFLTSVNGALEIASEPVPSIPAELRELVGDEPEVDLAGRLLQ